MRRCAVKLDPMSAVVGLSIGLIAAGGIAWAVRPDSAEREAARAAGMALAEYRETVSAWEKGIYANAVEQFRESGAIVALDGDTLTVPADADMDWMPLVAAWHVQGGKPIRVRDTAGRDRWRVDGTADRLQIRDTASGAVVGTVDANGFRPGR